MHPDCPDFDLCEICEAHPIPVHPVSHVMLKIRAPNATIPKVCRAETCLSLAPRSEEPHFRSRTPVTPRELSLPGAFDLPSPVPNPPSPFFYRSASSRSPSPEAETGFATPEFMPEPPSLSGLNHLRSFESTPLLHGMPFGLKDSVSSAFGHSNPFESETDQNNIPHRHPDAFHSEWRAACLALQRPISPDALPSIASSGVHVNDGDHGASNPEISRDRSASPRPWMPIWQQLYDSLQVREVDNAVLDDIKPDQASTATPPSLDSLSASVESINVPTALEHLRSPFTTWPKASELVHLMGNASLHGDEPNASTLPVEESPLSGTEPLLNRPLTFTASNVPEMVQSNKEPVSGIKSLATLLDDTYRDTPSEPTLAQSGELHAEENVDTAAPLLAQFISDVTVADGSVFPPGAEFMKCWKMKNIGSKDWADDTELVFLAGESLARDKFATSTVKIGSVKAGAEVELWTGELKAKRLSLWCCHCC
jgi:next to BRCA1 gene 1 protein